MVHEVSKRGVFPSGEDSLPKKSLPPRYNIQKGGAEYLIITKEILVLISAHMPPPPSMIAFFIRGICPRARHASGKQNDKRGTEM